MENVNLDNRGIVIQGRKATVLPETRWVLLRRLYDSKTKTATLDELCDGSKGEMVWRRDLAPDHRTLSHFASNINRSMEEAEISIRVACKDGVFSLYQWKPKRCKRAIIAFLLDLP